MQISLVYVPCKDEEEAKSIGRKLVELKLVGCVNVFPINSCFIWEGKINNADESVLLCKVPIENVQKVRDKIKELHSFDIPAIASWNVDVDKDYYDWMTNQE